MTLSANLDRDGGSGSDSGAGSDEQRWKVDSALGCNCELTEQ